MTTTTKTTSSTTTSGEADVLLLSCYELGRPPLGVAGPLGHARALGLAAAAADLAVVDLPTSAVASARFVAVSTPMHTALRLGIEAARRVRRLNPAAHVCFHGLYAGLNADLLLGQGLADAVVRGDDDALVARLAAEPRPGLHGGETPARPDPRVRPDFSALPPPSRYSHLVRADGATAPAGAVESTRGCKHLCRHCPVVPVYGGRFHAVPVEAVMADVEVQVARGAAHISFADPDFLNGPAHARRVVEALGDRHPGVTFDFTAKVDHLLAWDGGRTGGLRWFSERGAAFVVSAVESFSDKVLDRLGKGHTRAQALALFAAARRAGLVLRPTFLPFTPWAARSDYRETFELLETHELVGQVDPVQLTLRLLLPAGSALLDLDDPDLRPGAFDPAALAHPWRHPDPDMDALQAAAAACAAQGADSGADPAATYEALRALAFDAAVRPARPRPAAPRMSEAWFCCAEPTACCTR